MLNILLQKYKYTDIFLTNKYGEAAFSINYDKLDLAPWFFQRIFPIRSWMENRIGQECLVIVL